LSEEADSMLPVFVNYQQSLQNTIQFVWE
jgi:hypothetical protein